MFAAPFALYAVWWLVGRKLNRRMFWIAIIWLLAVGGGSVWYGLERSLSGDEAYVPAHLENGRIVQGHGVPK